MATFAIGDIHGCLLALDTLRRVTPVGNDDTLVLLGDYIDRGPDSRGVVDWILKYRQTNNLVTLRGNHEIMMLNARDNTERFFSWQHFGGEETLHSYDVADGTKWQDCVPEEHWHFFESTERYFETDTHIFVHAGLKPKLPLEEQDDVSLFWRKYLKPKQFTADKVVICGHTSQKDGLVSDFEHTVCIDTYAYGDQWLTCLNVDSGEYWQANQMGDWRQSALGEDVFEEENHPPGGSCTG